jgi:hypothetical protein
MDRPVDSPIGLPQQFEECVVDARVLDAPGRKKKLQVAS